MARYLVTGATGFLGAELVKQLLGRGHQVVALARSPAKAALLRTLGVEIHQGDITDRAALRRPMEGANGVFHTAAWYRIGVREPSASRINVEGTRHVLETMHELRIPKGVYTSSLVVFGNTRGRIVDESFRYEGPLESEYARTKWRAHYEVALPAMQAGLPLVAVLPGVIYGPNDPSAIRQFWVRHLRGRLPAVPGRTAYCWGYIEDVARGHILAMERGAPGESYILSGPPHTVVEALRIAARVSGRRAPLVAVPPFVFRAAARLAARLERAVDLPPGLTAEGLRVLGGVTYLGSYEKARRMLGFEPRSLEEGLRATLEHEERVLSPAPPPPPLPAPKL